MNVEETLVYNFLKSNGFSDIDFEPIRNSPPDFLVNQSIAIEVRRLNENYFQNGKMIGFQEQSNNIFNLLNKFLSGYQSSNIKASYWLSAYYERPLPDFKQLIKQLKLTLDCFFQNPEIDIEIPLTDTFNIRLTNRGTKAKPFIELASMIDENGGGLVYSIYNSNINHCIKEKAEKIKKVYGNYKTWWLILIDNIMYGLADREIDLVMKNVNLDEVWNKLVILSSSGDKQILVIER